MLAHISRVKNNHKTPPTILGWNAMIDYACEESLYCLNIWIQGDRPNSGIIYDIMKKCRSVYHYMLRSLKKERENIKVAISKDSLNFNQGTYWKKILIIDGHIGDAETIQYYLEQGDNFVCLLLLDTSKAFDKVSFEMLFELLLTINVCPRIIKLLYVHQKCYVKWANELSEPFTVANGVKQGAVISPLLFSSVH